MLILKTNDKKIFVSPKHIVSIEEYNDKYNSTHKSILKLSNGDWVYVEDTFDEIMDALKKLAAPQLPAVLNIPGLKR